MADGVDCEQFDIGGSSAEVKFHAYKTVCLFFIPGVKDVEVHKKKWDRGQCSFGFVQHIRIFLAGERGDVQGEKGKSENIEEGGGKQGEPKYIQNCKGHLLLIDCLIYFLLSEMVGELDCEILYFWEYLKL